MVLQVIEQVGHKVLTDELYQKVSAQAKSVLLDCATPDAVVRLNASSLGQFTAQSLSEEYYYRQQHNSFADFLRAHLCTMDSERHAIFTEVIIFLYFTLFLFHLWVLGFLASRIQDSLQISVSEP